jgi:hypothetical protein
MALINRFAAGTTQCNVWDRETLYCTCLNSKTNALLPSQIKTGAFIWNCYEWVIVLVSVSLLLSRHPVSGDSFMQLKTVQPEHPIVATAVLRQPWPWNVRPCCSYFRLITNIRLACLIATRYVSRQPVSCAHDVWRIVHSWRVTQCEIA